ncbi:MAG: manganese efflux pump, partial [Candidatus Hydrogenedentes bacterium]|nr:manganese efflux pump [Candidatus Hydrogenedentota bacterium]
MITLFFIAVGLAMDAFAVSITSGITIKRLKIKHALIIAACFGGFQAFMPALGWFIGHGLRDIVEEIDHWVAFVLLSAIGLKMIYESRKIEQIEEKPNPLDPWVLLALAVATSID